MLKSIFISLSILLLTGCNNISSTNKKTSKLSLIQSRGSLICGVSGKIPGFSFLNSDGTYSGLDVDMCKAFATTILGTQNNISYRQVTAAERFLALRTGEIDILSRNTTVNLSRDAKGGNSVEFGPVVFYDGQGIMVKKESNIKSLNNLNGKSICVGSGTTSEQNINDVFERRNIEYTPIKYQDLDKVLAGYKQNRCIAMTSDLSQLASAKSSFKNPDLHIILPDVLSKEPLAPATVGNDQSLSDAIEWTIFALIEAEELGINIKNVDDKYKQAQNNINQKKIRRFFGIDSNLGFKLGLKNDFTYQVIKNVGNYADIYNRNLGPDTKINIKRGLNKLYKDGGILISPPFN